MDIRICITDSLCSTHETNGASLVVQLVKNLSSMQGTLVQFLGGKDPLGNG